MARKVVPVSVIVPDASPLLTLGRVGRLDVLARFSAPIHVVDVVVEEARRPQNDVNGAVSAWWAGRPNTVSEEQTLVGEALRARRARGETPPTGNLGEIAVDEYATRLAKGGRIKDLPLVLFEDPDVLELRVARLRNVHLLNTAGLLVAFQHLGIMKDAMGILDHINSLRATPMLPVERPARTNRVQSALAKAVEPLE